MKTVIIEYTDTLQEENPTVRENLSTMPLFEQSYNFASDEERVLFCKIIQVAAEDYLKGCGDAEDFFFGESKDDCISYFDHLALDYGYFVRLLKDQKNA